MPRALPAAESTCAGNKNHPKGKSSKRWPLPCPSDYVSEVKVSPICGRKSRKKLPPYLLPTSSPGWGEILKAEGRITWLSVSGANQFLLPCRIHALGYPVLP